MSSEPAKAPVKEGDLIAGKYRVERQIGSGGMGVVMSARHMALDELVALKFVTEGRSADREAMTRMMREARATFRLRSEHTVRVLDVGELPEGPLYIVMELLEGRDLKAELTARGPLPEAEVVEYVLQACIALDEAHALGIVHRDLKPHNMFLAQSARGRRVLKVLDFGMSKLDPEHFEASPLTRPATALGTPRYMAPEQWKSAAEVDARADVWALGVVMYELLTGAAPVNELRGEERQARLLAGAIPSPREVRPDVSESVARVVMRCLRADPDGRFRSVRHLATALRDAHPELARAAERAEVTRTDVTRAVPQALMEKQAAEATAATDESPDDPRSTTTRPTMPDLPAARPRTPTAPEDFEAATEIRPPLFTPASLVDETLPATQPPKKMPASKAHAQTLRSAAATRAEVEAIVLSPPREETLRMAAAPAREALAALHVPAAATSPAAAQAAPAIPITSLPAAPPRPVAPPRLAPRALVLIAAGTILSLTLLVALGWLVTWSMLR